MNIKQKLEKTKKKVVEYKPIVIGLDLAIGAIATGVYAVNKTLKEGQEVLLISAFDSDDYDNIVILTTKEAQTKIAGDNSFNLTHVYRDLYSMDINSED